MNNNICIALITIIEQIWLLGLLILNFNLDAVGSSLEFLMAHLGDVILDIRLRSMGSIEIFPDLFIDGIKCRVL